MEDTKGLVAREREAYVVLSRIRDARSTLPAGHPAAASLDEAATLAESYWRELRAAVEILETAVDRDRAGGQQRADRADG